METVGKLQVVVGLGIIQVLDEAGLLVVLEGVGLPVVLEGVGQAGQDNGRAETVRCCILEMIRRPTKTYMSLKNKKQTIHGKF